MDFAASEAKKRGQSFPGTAVNLRRKRPGTGQPCPMRPTSAGRSGPGFVPGTPVDFAGTKNFFAPAGSSSRPKTVDMPRPVTRSRDGENAPSAGQPACGEQFAPKGYGYALPGHTHPGQRKRPICRAASLRGAVRAQRLWMCPARPPQKASGTKQKRHPDRMPFCLVRITGLEPAQYCYH